VGFYGMNYPIWTVPFLGGSWIIGIIACLHIFVSHFAVGGGMFFALTEAIAHKRQDNNLYDYLKKHSMFFLLLTTVFGAVSGVAIWWSISLVSPDATHTLIQTYTLGWACEYVFFVAELATIFVYYYTWGRVSEKTHLAMARWYAIHSVLTLVIINGIITFMLTPGDWMNTHYWLQGFFNPTYWPGLLIRLCVMAAIAGMYALVTTAKLPHNDFRTWMLRYSAKWFLPIFVIGPVLFWWYFNNLPTDVVNTIFNGIQTSGVGNFSILTRAVYLSLILSGTILVYAFVGPYLNPRGFSFKASLAFLLCGVIVTSIGEWSREMLRKPYTVYGYMYSNGLKVGDIDAINAKGYLATSKWAKAAVAGLDPTTDLHTYQLQAGKSMFQGQCMACHTENGYRSMSRMLGDRDAEAILAFVQTIHKTDRKANPYMGIMPPAVGTDDEMKALAVYLSTINAKNPTKALAQAH
jgi:cytochrome d ubiquinol oxidase subunit I